MKSTGYCKLCGKIKEHFCCQSCYEQDATKSSSKQELGKKIVRLEQELEKAQARIEELEKLLAEGGDIPGDFGTHQYHDIG